MTALKKVRKILVIRFRRVGDAVLSIAICSSLRNTFPDARIDLVLNANIACLFTGHPDVDQVISFNDYENKNFLTYITKVWNLVRVNRYDVIIDTRSTLRTLFFSLFSLKTPFRIGTRKKYNFLAHNYRIDNHCDRTNDIIKNNLLLLEPLEQAAKVRYCPEFRLYVSAQEKQSFRIYMEQQGIDFSRPVILAAIAARRPHKIWDKCHMKAILTRIIEKYQAQIVFNFASNEESFALDLHREMNHDKRVFTHIKARCLRELCAMTANCDFFFGNEGGPRHIAQALQVPGYAIFPPGAPKRLWLPAVSERYSGIDPDDVCSPEDQQTLNYLQRFNLITVERVWAGLNPMLAKYLE